jgi:hypothetical protein
MRIYGNAVAIDGAEIGLGLKIDGGEINMSASADNEVGVAQRVGGGTKYHDRLENRDLPDQHPIAAITGLEEALDAKVDASSLSVIDCGTATEVV